MHDMDSMLPPLGWHELVTSWQFRPGWTVTAAVLLALYGWGLVRCRRAGVRAVHPARVACFVAGVLLLLVTVSSAVDVYAMALFWVHMIEHLLLIMVVPALLILGHPLRVLVAATTPPAADGVASPRPGWGERVLGSAPVALLTHPLVGLGIYAAVIVGTHLTGFMDAMAMHPWLMGAEQVLYVVTGYVFLLPIVGAEPLRWRLPYLGRLMLVLVAMTPDTVVGLVLLQTDRNLFPMMTSMRPAWAPAPLDDIGLAGGLMWACGDGLMMLIGLGIVTAMILSPGRQNVLGARLENVRRQTMAGHVSRVAAADGSDAEESATTFTSGVDLDDDDAVLEAYNRMLGGLDRRR